ncbi:MAG: VTT domain-containing protein [Clostridia bacterium]|nr:VTT domain-containing protein [Clostridia bacterium]
MSKKTKNTFGKSILAIFWIILVVFCFINRDKITAERIAAFSPENKLFAVSLILCLFAVKSVSVFIYGGILYTVNGMLFSLPVAIVMNILGSAVMTTIPFAIGKKGGYIFLDKLNKQYPKIAMLKDRQNKNSFLTAFIIRIIGVLPSDIVSMYLGACKMSYKPYIIGTLVGLLPTAVSFAVMGDNIHDTSSPAFIMAAAGEILLMLISIIGSYAWKKRRIKFNKGG